MLAGHATAVATVTTTAMASRTSVTNDDDPSQGAASPVQFAFQLIVMIFCFFDVFLGTGYFEKKRPFQKLTGQPFASPAQIMDRMRVR